MAVTVGNRPMSEMQLKIYIAAAAKRGGSRRAGTSAAEATATGGVAGDPWAAWAQRCQQAQGAAQERDKVISAAVRATCRVLPSLPQFKGYDLGHHRN